MYVCFFFLGEVPKGYDMFLEFLFDGIITYQ